MHEKFLEYLAHERRYSIHTIKSYQTDLIQLRDYLAENYDGGDVIDVSFDQLRSWMVYLVESGISSRSISRKISSVKSLFKWAKRYEGVEVDPTRKLTLPKVAKRLPVYVEEEQMDYILDAAKFPSDFEGIRDRLIVEMFYQTGIRCSELISLETKKIDFHQNVIKVLGKRNKERIIPVGDEIFDLIREYQMRKDELEHIEDTKYLFLTKKGVKMYPKLVYSIVNNYLREVSTLRKKSPHVLRHTFATHMLNRGADLNAIKELLGHTSLAATQVYTHNSIDQLKDVHRNAHPSGREER